jgi:hypothetical protein
MGFGETARVAILRRLFGELEPEHGVGGLEKLGKFESNATRTPLDRVCSSHEEYLGVLTICHQMSNGGQKMEDRGRRTEDGGQRMEDRGRRESRGGLPYQH